MESVGKKVALLIAILGLLFLSSFAVGLMLLFASGTPEYTQGNVAVIPIKGIIVTQAGSWADAVDPVFVRESIADANEDETIKAIVLEIDSPGGSPVASDEIAQALKRSEKPTVAFIREVGASGGYWIAANTDHIIANRMSITGSVGVTASYLEFAGTLRRYNATYQQITGGERKELGTPFKELEADEREIIQRKIDAIHEMFIEEVRTERNLSDAQVSLIRSGEFFIGTEALDLGLVDELGSFEELDAHLNATIGEEPQYVYYEKQLSFWDEFSLVKTSFFPSVEEELSSSRVALTT